jgi:hypothetical protein
MARNVLRQTICHPYSEMPTTGKYMPGCACAREMDVIRTTRSLRSAKSNGAFSHGP